MTTPEPLPLPLMGSAIMNRYELRAPIARGGMGVVYRGWDHWLHRSVAVKAIPLLSSSRRSSPHARAQWQWEALVLAATPHPHVVTIFDALEDGAYGYVIMEYVEGCDLKRYIERTGPLPCREALNVGVQVCRALQALHERGLIHSDVKPQNILRSPSGWMKLIDFGITQRIGTHPEYAGAWARSGEHVNNARQGALIGTPTYCAPEQAQNDTLTPAVDVYSLGVVLYELLAGVPPFISGTPLGLAVQHITAPPPLLHSFRPGIPTPVEQVILRALAKNPALRFASAEAMRIALEHASAVAELSTSFAPSHPVGAGSMRARSYPDRATRSTATLVGAKAASVDMRLNDHRKSWSQRPLSIDLSHCPTIHLSDKGDASLSTQSSTSDSAPRGLPSACSAPPTQSRCSSLASR